MRGAGPTSRSTRSRPTSTAPRRCGAGALPPDGGGLGGGDVSRRASRAMKKHPVHGARARARTLRQDMTEPERRVWQILRSQQMNGYKFRRQLPMGCYFADFVCHEARLIVEIDGGQHDRSSPQERERTGFLRDEGYRVLRFWNDEVLTNLDGVHQTIAEELGRITPTQALPHQGGGFQGEALREQCSSQRQLASGRPRRAFARACRKRKVAPEGATRFAT
jgi:very-short-patch-repair endonuclease